ncbi:MAG: hypothetical protein ACKVOU_15090, partial [Cytophagales bacterium]
YQRSGRNGHNNGLTAGCHNFYNASGFFVIYDAKLIHLELRHCHSYDKLQKEANAKNHHPDFKER